MKNINQYYLDIPKAKKVANGDKETLTKIYRYYDILISDSSIHNASLASIYHTLDNIGVLKEISDTGKEVKKIHS